MTVRIVTGGALADNRFMQIGVHGLSAGVLYTAPAGGSALLLETGDYLLLETGDHLLLE